MISEEWLLQTTLRLSAFSVLLQSLEMLAIRSSWRESGPWSWSRLRQDFRVFGSVPFWFFDRALSSLGYLCLILVQIALCAGCLLIPHLYWIPPLFVLVLLGCLRWRGTFNGGSDYMTVLVLLALSIAAGLGGGRSVSYALGYIGLQTLASYFVAGLVKVKQPEWRSGYALKIFLSSPAGHSARMVTELLSRQSLCLCAAWAVMLFELLSPAVLLFGKTPQVFIAWLVAAIAFHVMNAWTLGLNRFVWAWLVGYCGVLRLTIL